LMAFPGIGVADSGDSSRIEPRRPRYDRIAQLRPDLLALDKLFARLQRQSPEPNSRMFSRARKNVSRMLAALPLASPTVSAKEPSAVEATDHRRRR
jgi:hypothetical protein